MSKKGKLKKNSAKEALKKVLHFVCYNIIFLCVDFTVKVKQSTMNGSLGKGDAYCNVASFDTNEILQLEGKGLPRLHLQVKVMHTLQCINLIFC